MQALVVRLSLVLAFVLSPAPQLGGAAAPAPRSSSAPPAITFTVDTTADLIDADTGDGQCLPGVCSLRAAVMQANQIDGRDVIIVVPAGTYILMRGPVPPNNDRTGDLNLTPPPSGNFTISIQGAGAGLTIIDAGQRDRAFHIDLGRTATIAGVTIRNGSAQDGGGIYNIGTLTVNDSTLSGNTASGGGGAIINFATLNLNRSTLSGNTAYTGGGIYSDAHISLGGFVRSVLFMTNSTLSQNNAHTDGGGLWVSKGDVNIYNSTIVYNGADLDQVGGGSGGGIWDYTLSIVNVRNTLVAGNILSNSPQPDECTGTLYLYGRNRIGIDGATDGCALVGSNDHLVTLSELGPLQNNGGNTWTHALLPGSNAIDAGLGCMDSNSILLPTDQRGFARVGGSACDIGAFEYYPSVYLPLVRR